MSDDNLTFRDIVKGFFAIGVAAIGIAGVVAATKDKNSAHKFLALSVMCFLISGSLVIRWFWSQNRDSQESLSITPPKTELPSTSHERKHVKQDAMGSTPTIHDLNLWTEYTQDKFYDVIWRWLYKPEIDNTPRRLIPFCPECDKPMSVSRPQSSGTTNPTTNKIDYVSLLLCDCHKAPHIIPVDGFGDFTPTKRLIQQKIQDGTWKDVVNRQRMSRGQSPI